MSVRSGHRLHTTNKDKIRQNIIIIIIITIIITEIYLAPRKK